VIIDGEKDMIDFGIIQRCLKDKIEFVYMLVIYFLSALVSQSIGSSLRSVD
jgi:hypothetical protein